MEQGLMGLAFGAGLVAVLNPCGFAMLPVYMTLVVRGDSIGELSALRRALVATVEMVLGFMTVFGAFGLLTVSAASTVHRYLPYVTVVIGSVLIALGIWSLAGRHLPGLNPVVRSSRWVPTARGSSMFGYGVGYAIASLSCTVGPFLAVTAASFRSGLIVNGLLTYLVYAAGMSLIVGVLAIAAAFANPIGIYRMRRILPYINRIGGAFVVIVGLYVAYYGVYEVRLFSGSATAEDPVIATAGRLQSALATWVHEHGGYPWLVALAVLVLGALAVAWARRLRRAAKVRHVLELRSAELSVSSA
ncbi:cytochrome c biogenesis CcdA family protein [Mycobacterium sp. CVI_P3]|uniref:Cytochrome c biogenesis CcdA family protein n=1 Tax=Mycobacterium pinniadriaticum TaxID=2994102 RepID=A0ABT3S9N4_9MYCO|nr:cytochrome c biogenesis CcdA family protein [Mycobacterium pinniadriaticum]MCX2929774.1 cytochrome c biogenesis CcdA family protein [Mycobacterium pinniadriaticum]MCX2936198.1 cytochrome c biogenesis CcdA family protein [Mycobacterium pinniadriaticum]